MKSEEEREREGGGLIEVKGPYGSTRRLTCATATAVTAADVEEEAAAVPVASLTATVTTAADVEEADVEEAAVPVASLTATCILFYQFLSLLLYHYRMQLCNLSKCLGLTSRASLIPRWF